VACRAVFLISLMGFGLRAQTATLLGSVVRDTADNVLGGAEVSLPMQGRTTTTNYRGEFRIDGLAAGKYLVVVRHVGFAALRDTIELTAAKMMERVFMLTPQAAQLDSVVVNAAPRKYISPALRGFEERSKAGFGHFFSDSALRKNDERQLSSLLRQMPGGMVGMGNHGAAFFVSSRKLCLGSSMGRCNPPNCYVTVYLDGAVIYSPAAIRPPPPAPDMNRIPVRELAGVEFYPGTATVPPQFSTPNDGCGTLLLWTRER